MFPVNRRLVNLRDDWVYLKRLYAESMAGVHLVNPSWNKFQERKKFVSNFQNLKVITRKYVPNKFPVIQELERIGLDYFDGKIKNQECLFRIKRFCRKEGLAPSFLLNLEHSLSKRNISPIPSNGFFPKKKFIHPVKIDLPKKFGSSKGIPNYVKGWDLFYRGKK